VGLPFVDFVQRTRIYAVPILLFIVLYKLGDAALNNMATPFLLKAGFTQTQIGAVQGVMGLAATIVGVIVGGAVQARIGLVRALWIFGVLQSAVNVTYWLLSTHPGNHTLMVSAVVLENFFQGMGTAALVAYLMSLSSPRFAATQYALLSSFMAFGRDWLTAPAGKLAEQVGWPGFFLRTMAMAVPGLLLLPFVAPWNAERVRGAAASATADDTVGGLGESADVAPEQRL
jgi:PAT family beta-lactamase induction signal transducer AmpG